MLNHALRYAPVIKALDDAPGRRLLEVGSGSRGIAAFTSGFEITACDVSFDDYGGGDAGTRLPVRRVQGSVLDLPFEEAAFDVVLALDLLEHINPADRTLALHELRRVSRGLLIVGCPCGRAAEAADKRLSEHLLKHGKSLPGWLVEHLDHGLPDSVELCGAARPGDPFYIIQNVSAASHERVLRWEATPIVGRLTLIVAKMVRISLRTRGVSRRIATQLLALLGGGNRPPVYREIAVVTTNATRQSD